MIAVLFARRDSIYKTVPGLDVWDEDRDARKWPGGAPVIAHPPCRLWGRLHHLAKSSDIEAERALGLYAIGRVREFGGVLEHPEYSKLWKAGALPVPGSVDAWGGYTIMVRQSDWGHRAEKRTWLYVVGVGFCDLPAMPRQASIAFGLVELMGQREREATPPAFAAWLVELAGRVRRA